MSHARGPALVLATGRTQVHRSMSLLLGLGLAWGLGAAVWLLVELGRGPTQIAEYWDLAFPFWWMLAASVPMAVIAFESAYGPWRATGRRHGFLDLARHPDGLAIVHPRFLARPQTLLVEPGQRVEITASVRNERRGGRSYRFTVAAPGGIFVFDQDVHVEQLSLAPLDDAAQPLGIQIVTDGAAEAIGRRRHDSLQGG